LHRGIITEALAILGATLADLRAQAASLAMQRRVAQHEIGARLTNIGAVEQQTNMSGLRMSATHTQTVRHRFQADAVALQTILDTLLNFLILLGHVLIAVVRHRSCSFPYI
jgi:hypothetical protein